MKSLLLIVIIVLILLLAVIVGFVLLKHFLTIKRKKTFEDIKKEIVIDKIFAIEKTLIRVSEIAEVNDKFMNVSMKLNTLHDQLLIIHNRVDKLMKDLEKEIYKKGKVNLKLVTKIVSEIRTKNKKFKELDEDFKSYSIQVTHQDEYIRNEFQFYQKNLRFATDLYSHKRILLDKISPQIDDFRNKVKDVEKEFEAVIDKIDTEKVDNVLRRYSKLVIKFTNLINEGPSIFVKLYKEIPQLAQSLKNEYLAKKKEISAPLEHIDFSNSLKEISKIHKNAINAFKELNIEKAKIFIKNTLKAFKTLQKMINLEINSRNTFLKLYEPTMIEIKRVLKSYVSIKKQFQNIIGKGETMPQESFEKYELIKKIAKSMDLSGIKYRELMKDKTISYSAKISRLKNVLQDIIHMTNEMNEFIEIIWAINLEDSIFKNKFKRSEAAINELIANLKKESIQLTIDQQREFNKLIEQKTHLLSSIIDKRVTKSVAEQIDAFASKATKFYSVVNGNAQIAMHIKNMLKELAPKRVVNDRLNLLLQMSEKDFLDGKYASSLNIIIDAVKEEGVL